MITYFQKKICIFISLTAFEIYNSNIISDRLMYTMVAMEIVIYKDYSEMFSQHYIIVFDKR